MYRLSPKQLLLALALPLLLSACASRGIPQPLLTGEQPEARTLLLESARAHGLDAWQSIRDISVSYAGEWYGLVSKVQPTLIDADFRQGSQERLTLGESPIIAQHHEGPGGNKQVIRPAVGVEVFYNGVATTNTEKKAAAALVADGYRMFLTSPFYFLTGNLHLEMGEPEEVDGRACDTLVAVRRPGHGLSTEDRYLLYIDREDKLLRRVRFSMEGLDSTKGAIAEVDFFEHQKIAGVVWPTRFHERLKKPIPNLPVHDWRLTGLDINRGMQATEISSTDFNGRALAPAKALPAP